METPGISRVDYPAYFGYLRESEAELLKIGIAKCNGFHDQTQLSAVIFLLLRATSLFRSGLSILANGPLDAYDAVRRAYLETWLLAYEFRLEGSQPKTARWHNRIPKSWSPDFQLIEAYTKAQGITEPMLGKDYGGLSEAAHPTKSAAENSFATITAPRGEPIARASLIAAKTHCECKDVPMTMYRFIWLITQEQSGLIRIEADMTALPTADTFANEYANTLS